jgi:hypothetical protein
MAAHTTQPDCAIQCGRFRGWLPRQGFQFLTNLAQRFGAPAEPIILRDSSIGDHAMTDKLHDNSGILFRNSDKSGGRDRDYKGEATISGVEYWMSGWIKEGKKGKFMTFSFKPKDAPKETAGAVPFSDEVPF